MDRAEIRLQKLASNFFYLVAFVAWLITTLGIPLSSSDVPGRAYKVDR